MRGKINIPSIPNNLWFAWRPVKAYLDKNSRFWRWVWLESVRYKIDEHNFGYGCSYHYWFDDEIPPLVGVPCDDERAFAPKYGEQGEQ